MRDCGSQSGLWLRCPIYIDQPALAIGIENLVKLKIWKNIVEKKH